MTWICFLHFYQPYNQKKEVLARVVAECYLPILTCLASKKLKCHITANVSGSLLRLLAEQGFSIVIDLLRTSVQLGNVEIVSSSAYHAFLPLLPKEEISRQIALNNDIVHQYIPEASLEGFFSPEMAVSQDLVSLISNLGYKYMIVDEIAIPTNTESALLPLFILNNPQAMHILTRNRKVSNVIMSGLINDKKDLKSAIDVTYDIGAVLVTAMDAETFGHHRIGLEKLLIDILKADDIPMVTASEALQTPHAFESLDMTTVRSSTWASSLSDISNNVQFLSWQDPENPIHKMQWQLLNLALTAVAKLQDKPSFFELRARMDTALGSDHFWWASAKPWWSIEMIEEGAHSLLTIVDDTNSLLVADNQLAHKLYETILSTAFAWQRNGVVDKLSNPAGIKSRIPFKLRTLGVGGKERGIYEAFLQLLHTQEKRAARKQNYEKATLWRDASYKIKHQHDIYDAVHAIDLLRKEVPHSRIERILDRYTARYKEIRGGQPEQRGN